MQPPPAIPVPYARGINDIAGFHSADGFQHAIALRAGVVIEAFFKANAGRADVASIPAALALDAFESVSFGLHRMVYVLQTDGDVHQVWYRSDGDVGSRALDNVAAGIDLAAFEDHSAVTHVVVLTAAGELVELTLNGLGPVARRVLASVPGATRVAGFQAGDDLRCIVIVGQADGGLTEIFYLPGGPPSGGRIAATGPAIVDLAAFYTSDDHVRHAVVIDASGQVRETYYGSFAPAAATLRSGTTATRIGGYVTFDSRRHVVLGFPDGAVREIAFGGPAGLVERALIIVEDAVARAEFVGPVVDAGHAAITYSPSPTGVIYAVAGDQAVTYAISLNAGVWRGGAGLPWISLPKSPRFSQCLSVDPSDRSHIFVGERDGDAAAGAAANHAGLWESRDLGVTWSYALNPLTLTLAGSSLACTSQAIPCVFATADGGLLAGTQVGVVQRVGKAGPVLPLAGFWGRGPITGVAQTTTNSRTLILARTVNQLLWSFDGGVTVNAVGPPAQANDGAGNPRQMVPASSPGLGFGFAAYGGRAAFIVSVDPAYPRLASLEFDVDANTWRVDSVGAGDGTGLGGRLLIKAQPSAGFAASTGQPFALLMGGAQTVHLGTTNGDPRVPSSARGITWRDVAETHWNPTPPDHYLMQTQSDVHTDIWDVHLSEHPEGDPELMIAGDGGIFGSALGHILSTSTGKSPQYLALNDGLGTHHVHVARLIDPSYAHRSGILTSTSDNDCWWLASRAYAGQKPLWQTGSNLGDGNAVVADPRVTDAVLLWRQADTTNIVRSMLAPTPPLDGLAGIYPSAHFSNEHQFSTVPRTMGSEKDQLDLVALARFGVTAADTIATACDPNAPPLTNVGSGWRTVVVRTTDFAANRSISLPNPASAGWTLLAEAPSGSQRVWASGNRRAPTLFFYAETVAATATGTQVLTAFYRRLGGQNFYAQLPGIGATAFPGPLCGMNGPLFVSPYDPNDVYAIATDGIWQLVGNGFALNAQLTALVTRSGTYPMLAGYVADVLNNSGDGKGLNLLSTRARKLTTLVDVAYDAADPYRVAIASAFGSVYFVDRREGIWRDLTPLLPTPAAEIGSVSIAHDGVFIGYEGRSMWQVVWPELAPEATIFQPPPARSRFSLGVSLGRLETASGKPVPGASVTVTIPATASAASNLSVVHTTADGSVPLPGGVTLASLSGRAVWLDAQPGGGLAPAFRRWIA